MRPYAVFLLIGLVNAAPKETVVVRTSYNLTTAVTSEPSKNDKFREIVHFGFGPGTHSIVQTSRDAPCTPLSGGFASPLVGKQNETFSIAVEKDSPVIWFVCAQHCNEDEVGAIFPVTADEKGYIDYDPGNNYDKFYSNAKSAKNTSFASLPQEGTPVGSGVGAQVLESSGTRIQLAKAALGAIAAGVVVFLTV